MAPNAQQSIYAQIYRDINDLKRPLVVGINGAYTAGKTIFTDGLDRYLQSQGVKTQIIHYDDFHHPFSSIKWTEDTEVEAFCNHAFDPGKLEAEVLVPLKAEGFLHKDVLCVDLNTNHFTKNIHFDIDENTIVLLEGVLLFRKPLLPYLDYKVYLDVSTDEMLRRAEQRDVPRFGEWILEKFTTRYIPVHERYVAEYNPRAVADLVIDNNDHGLPSIILQP